MTPILVSFQSVTLEPSGSKELVLGVPNSSGSRNLIVVMDFEMTHPNIT